MSVVGAQFYSIPVGLQFYSIPVGLPRLFPARYSEWDEAIKGQHLVIEGETRWSRERTIKLQISAECS